ncbi:hypothetical protein C4D60_Mb05t31090 [Musa balbisiana]|uniref:Ferritin n=1 Tax=Musa balbisiana TaxID=52838 RepID=A0A4S8K040_MUSBA|nr:hypothetical protein C4D60_Mb05t31090 [Musa balbisiana]
MLLKASASLAFLSASPPHSPAALLRGPHPSFSASFVPFRSPRGLTRRASVVAAAAPSDQAITGVVFQSVEEIQKELSVVPTAPGLSIARAHLSWPPPPLLTKHHGSRVPVRRGDPEKELSVVPTAPGLSIARQKYDDDCEAAINEQINVEYNNSYIYHALFAYFDRDNVALKGVAKFFKESSEEERVHAEKLMEYQNKRGGRVKLQLICRPPSELDHPEKGDALYAMELALCLEKLTNEKLLNLHSVADRCNDAQLTDFIESEFLEEQGFGILTRCSLREKLHERLKEGCDSISVLWLWWEVSFIEALICLLAWK